MTIYYEALWGCLTIGAFSFFKLHVRRTGGHTTTSAGLVVAGINVGLKHG